MNMRKATGMSPILWPQASPHEWEWGTASNGARQGREAIGFELEAGRMSEVMESYTRYKEDGEDVLLCKQIPRS